MQLILSGKNIDINDWLREYVEKRIGKLDRYLSEIQDVRVELSVEKTKSNQDRMVAQVTVRGDGTILRAEERTDELSVAIDAVVDKIHRQIARYKGKRMNRWRGQGSGRNEPEMPPLSEAALEELAEEQKHRIVRTKRFVASPMHEEEAIEQMELLGHDFFIFHNPDRGMLNVVYQRRDGNYGLLEPEIG